MFGKLKREVALTLGEDCYSRLVYIMVKEANIQSVVDQIVAGGMPRCVIE